MLHVPFTTDQMGIMLQQNTCLVTLPVLYLYNVPSYATTAL